MRYKVIHEKVCVAEFETAQCAGDYLFTIPAEKITAQKPSGNAMQNYGK